MRPLSKMHIRDLREVTGDGLERCKERITAARLLDKCDAAKSLKDIKVVLSELISRVTGEK